MCFTRRFGPAEAESPVEVKEAFKKYSDGGTHMNVDQFQKFLTEVQSENESDAERIMDHILQKRHHISKFARHSLTLDDFHHYLFSADFNPPIGVKVCFLYWVFPLIGFFL